MNDLAKGFGQSFGGAVKGEIPSEGKLNGNMLMGRPLSPGGVLAALEAIGNGAENGHVDLTTAAVAAAKAAKDLSGTFVRATPGGGLAPTGDETVRYKYDTEKNAAMFGGTAPT